MPNENIATTREGVVVHPRMRFDMFGMAIVLIMVTMTKPALAGNICVYVNDDIFYDGGGVANTVDGYLVTANSQSYIEPVATGGESSAFSSAQDIVVSPRQNILFVANNVTADVGVMSIDPATCEVALLANYPVGKPSSGGIGLAISPNGRWLYVIGISTNSLQVFGVRKDGSLMKSDQTLALPQAPSDFAVSPDGATLIVDFPRIHRSDSREALSYSINATDGTLTFISRAPTRGSPGGIAIDANSRFVYIPELGAKAIRVAVLEIGAGSTLSYLRSYDFTETTVIASEPTALVSVNGRYLYVTNPQGASIATLAVNHNTGGLRYGTTSGDGVPGQDFPLGLATSKNGQFIFTGQSVGHKLGILAASHDGSLDPLGVFQLVYSGFTAWVSAKTF